MNVNKGKCSFKSAIHSNVMSGSTLLKCSAMWLFPHPTSRARGKVLQWHSGIKNYNCVIIKQTGYIIQDVKVDVTVKADGDWSCWALKTLALSILILFFKKKMALLDLHSIHLLTLASLLFLYSIVVFFLFIIHLTKSKKRPLTLACSILFIYYNFF